MRDLLTALVTARNADGGWGATRGARSDTESTALAVLALGAAGAGETDAAVRGGVRLLTRLQRPDGAWPWSDGIADPSWTTSLCAIALASFDTHRPAAGRGAEWLLRQQGRRPGWLVRMVWQVFRQDANRLDPGLRGWSWNADSFPWVEPTAYALIAVKKLRRELPDELTAERIRDGERLLLDRMCEGGGWNYGNSRVLGEPLVPYPETTGVALLALRDRREDARLTMSLDALGRLLDDKASGMALALGTLSFGAYGRDTDSLKAQIVDLFGRTRFIGQTASLALAVLALSDAHQRVQP